MPEPPVINPITLPHLVLPVTEVMPNGVRLHCLQGCNEEVVRIELVFKGGYSVQDKPLQAIFTNRMLREGSDSLSSAEISQKLDFYGAWIDMYSSQEHNHIILHVLAKHFQNLLPVIAGFVKNPIFPQNNFNIIRDSNKAHFLINSQKVDRVAQRHFEHNLWGEGHPLGHIVEAVDYDNLECCDMLSYYRRVYSSRNCTIFLSGCCNGTVRSAIVSAFGSEAWGSDSEVNITLQPAAPVIGRQKVVMENTMQSAVKVGCFTLPASSPDIYAFRFLNVLLGGYFGGRLMSNIRETHGYTYDIISEIDSYGTDNVFVISSEAATEYVEPLLKELYRELHRLRNELIPTDEVELVRNYILGELCREYEGFSAKSEVFINAWLQGQPFESVNRYLDVVKEVTPEMLQQIARNYINPDNMIEIVVGA